MRRDVNLTQVEVANIIGVERLSIIRYEQGMFGHLSDEIVDQLGLLYRVDQDLLVMEYRGYQRLKRIQFKEDHRSWREVLTGYGGLKHPLIAYRDTYNLSRNALCKALCLDYGPISAYEANKQRTIPEIIRIASEDIYWDYTALESAVLEWRASGRSSHAI
jgi:hypothetical protein